jgi:hypothetical protein
VIKWNITTEVRDVKKDIIYNAPNYDWKCIRTEAKKTRSCFMNNDRLRLEQGFFETNGIAPKVTVRIMLR